MTSRTRLWTKSIRRGRERARDKSRERPGPSENQAKKKTLIAGWAFQTTCCTWNYFDNSENVFILYILRYSHPILLCKEAFRILLRPIRAGVQTSFSHVKKVASSNHKRLFRRIVFSRSSRVALLGRLNKIIFPVHSSSNLSRARWCQWTELNI